MGITQEEADVLGAEFLYGSWITKLPKVKWKISVKGDKAVYNKTYYQR